MKNKKVSCILAVLIILIFSSISLAAIPVEVTVGKETILTLKEPGKRASLADPNISGMTLISPSEIVLSGKKPGTTSLIVWDKKGKPTFFDVNVFGDVTVLIKQIKDMVPDADIKVETAGDSIVLTGGLKNEQTRQNIETIAKAYAPKVINLIVIKEAQQVLLEVKVAQIDKTKLKELGLSFLAKGSDAEITAPGLFTGPTGNVGGAAGFDVSPGIASFNLAAPVPQIGVAYFPSGVAAVLKALASKGLAKILAEPNLVVRSGEKGNFLAGTKVPIQIITGTPPTPAIEYRDVGIKLNFAPEVLETDVIRLKIDPAEVSNIIRYLTFGNLIAPEIDTREVRTSVDLKEGESLILAGLLSEEMKKNIQKVPILGDIPILGAIFRSTSDELKEKELAFFITPRLVKPIAPGVKTELPTDNRPTPDEKREFQWIPLPKKESVPEGQGVPEGKPEESKSE